LPIHPPVREQGDFLARLVKVSKREGIERVLKEGFLLELFFL